ncbi:MAG: hypothetical protein H0T76_26650 [Nannocystis sp.]|nr:hypothetical protein [Nannocystis sp.]MBA3550075.1 hypothetical protein [Nannocystis sp.]
MTARAPLSLVVTLVLSSLTTSASASVFAPPYAYTHAPGPAMDPEAKQRFERGLAGYASKAYADAVKDFRIAYALDPRPEILFAWAQAERMYGRCSQASKLYTRFLKSKPSDQQAQAALTGIERCKDQPDTTPGDPEDIEEPKPVEEKPPEPEPEPEPEPPPPPPRPRIDPIGISLLSVGVALGAVGGGLLGVGENKARQLGGVTSYEAYADGNDQIRSLRIAGGVLAGVGGALIVGGIVKLIMHGRKSRQGVAFWTTPEGAGAIVRLRF